MAGSASTLFKAVVSSGVMPSKPKLVYCAWVGAVMAVTVVTPLTVLVVTPSLSA